MTRSVRGTLAFRRRAAEQDRLAREHPLRYLFLELTRRCNLRCVYCGSDCSPAPPGAELDTATWVELARQIARDFAPPQVMVAITGGEPLLKPGLFDLLAELRRLGFPFGLVTNGTLLDRAAARRLVASGIGSISLSLDSIGAVNDACRGAGVSDRVGRAIGALREAGFHGRLEVLSTLTRPAVQQLEVMRRQLAGQRVPLWRLVPLMPLGRAQAAPELQLTPADLRRVLDFVERSREDRLLPAPEFGEEGYLGEYEGRVRPYLCQCRAGLTTAGILADGSIGACPELGPSFVQGHVTRDRFRDVWQQRYQVFRDRSWTRRGLCADCDAWERCGGGSLHLYPDTSSGISRCFYRMLCEGDGDDCS